MNRKVLVGTLIAATSILALIFIILGNLELAVIFMSVLFAITNGSRAITFKEQGYDKEAKWMRGMSMFFSIGAVVLLIFYIL